MVDGMRTTIALVLLALVLALASAGCSAEPTVDAAVAADAAAEAADAPVTTEAPASAPPVPVGNSFRHVLHSDAIGEDFVIDVALPYYPPEKAMPVIYVIDGNTMFPLVASAARLLEFGGEVPPAIIVGIGYRDGSPFNVLGLRMRDLTPTLDAAYVERARQDGNPLPEGIIPGGAIEFLDFVENEVKPLVATNYPADPGDATLVGDSLGGLFALFTLFNRTGDYQRYLAGSPSLWWDERMVFADEAAYADRAEDLDASVFISVGALEEGAANVDDSARMVSNVREMAGILHGRGYPSLRFTSHVFEAETHLSVIPATLSRGLREVFRTN